MVHNVSYRNYSIEEKRKRKWRMTGNEKWSVGSRESLAFIPVDIS
jgi:hypothetical protein